MGPPDRNQATCSAEGGIRCGVPTVTSACRIGMSTRSGYRQGAQNRRHAGDTMCQEMAVFTPTLLFVVLGQPRAYDVALAEAGSRDEIRITDLTPGQSLTPILRSTHSADAIGGGKSQEATGMTGWVSHASDLAMQSKLRQAHPQSRAGCRLAPREGRRSLFDERLRGAFVVVSHERPDHVQGLQIHDITQ